MRIPMELSFGGVYLPPILLALCIGVLLAWIGMVLLKRFNYLCYIWHPPLFFLALTILCTWLVTITLVPV